MAITKPTFYPDGTAIGDATDISINQSNIPSIIRTGGFASGAELGSAEYNEFFNEMAKWIKWTDQALNVDKIVDIGTFNATFVTSVSVPFNFQKFASGRVKIWWGDISGLGTSSVNESATGAIPSGSPHNIIPTSSRHAPIIFSGGYGTCVIGQISFLNQTTHVGSIAFATSDGSSFTSIYSGCAEYII